MKLVMFGTGPFAVPTFDALLESTHQVLALVTRPIEDAGKRRKSAANPMRDLAIARGVAIHDPPNANAPEFVELLQSLAADLFVVCDFGQILSNDCLAVARFGGINLHGSLLPKFRGAAPINWAIYRGEKTTGITVIHMTSKLDGGPILATGELAIGPHDTTADLEPRLSQLGVQPVLDSLRQLEAWDGSSRLGRIQDPQLVSSARRLRKEDGLVRWSRTAKQIERQIRAFQPWPGVYTNWQRSNDVEPLRLIINRAEVINTDQAVEPGRVHSVERNRLLVETGKGLLSLLEVQPAGKKPMPIDAFLRGYPITVGSYFA
jgi:methionyl-tRNA formyltransferase